MFKRSNTADRDCSLLQRIRCDRAGNVTMIFGFSVITLFGVTGGAIDFARWYAAKSKIQMAMDSASLAGGRTLQITPTSDVGPGIAKAIEYYNQMKPAGVTGGSPVFTVVENGTVMHGEVNFGVPSPFLSLVGITQLEGRVVAETVIAAGGNAGTNLELSLMLDMTGSMGGQKIVDLKAAAKDLIDIVVWDDQSQYTSKIALAPFSARVNVGQYLSSVTDVDATRSINGHTRNGITCALERTGAEEFTDAKPLGTDMLTAHSGDKGNAAKTNAANYSSSGSCGGSQPIPEILPLTSSKDALKARVDALPATGSTAGALGTAWAWYLLSPRWSGIWQGDSLPSPYGDITTLGARGQPKLQKVAVLMTDGIYNTFGGHNYGDTSAEAVTISNKAVTLCNNMKAAGIKVYTIGFQLGGDTLATNTLKACASRSDDDPTDDPSFFFSAESGDELKGAFRQIALQLSTLRIRM